VWVSSGVVSKQKAMTRRMEQRCYRTMHNMDEEDAGAGLRSVGGFSSASQQSDDGMSHPLLDELADKLIDCLPRMPRWFPLASNTAPAAIQMTTTSRGLLQAPRKSPLRS
jgi:hypothetical protein